LLSVRDPESWYRSASNTIFQSFDKVPPELAPWMAAVVQLLRDRFSDSFDNPVVMMDAYERHNEAVRQSVPADRLLEWSATDGWDPICDRLGVLSHEVHDGLTEAKTSGAVEMSVFTYRRSSWVTVMLD
jgi:hypothetical protein